MSGGRRAASAGQALIETAVTIPILILLFLGFLAVGVAAQAYVDLTTAVNLAAASNVTAPANSPAIADGYARDTFDFTLRHFPQLTSPRIDCTGDYGAGGAVTCTGSADLDFRGSPLAIVVPAGVPRLTATATAVRSPFRSEPVGP